MVQAPLGPLLQLLLLYPHLRKDNYDLMKAMVEYSQYGNGKNLASFLLLPKSQIPNPLLL